MSEQTIYNALRIGGLTRTSVCAMMGNFNAESALISTNVEDRCTMSDAEYTQGVNNGTIGRQQFVNDSYGYGLAQWTHSVRKADLYDFVKKNGVSIGNEGIQCEYCLWELQNRPEYAGLYKFLCVTDNLSEATKRICAEYEQPAVNNFAYRINAAQAYFNRLAANDSGCTEDSCPFEPPVDAEDECQVNVRILKKGALGRDVFLLQCGLFDMGYDCGMPDGDFGANTQEAVKELQRANDVEASGIADWFVWQTILSKR